MEHLVDSRLKELTAIQNSGAKDCCKKLENLIRHQIDFEKVMNVCQVCGCRHFYIRPELLKKG